MRYHNERTDEQEVEWCLSHDAALVATKAHIGRLHRQRRLHLNAMKIMSEFQQPLFCNLLDSASPLVADRYTADPPA